MLRSVIILAVVVMVSAGDKPVAPAVKSEAKSASYAAPVHVVKPAPSYAAATQAPVKYAAPVTKGYVAPVKPGYAKATTAGYGISPDSGGHHGYYYYYYPVTEVPTKGGYPGAKNPLPVKLAAVKGLITALIPVAILGLAILVFLPIILGIFGIVIPGLPNLLNLGRKKRDTGYNPYIAQDKLNELTNIVEASFDHDECVQRFACETGDIFRHTEFSEFLISMLASAAPESYVPAVDLLKIAYKDNYSCKRFKCGHLRQDKL